MGRTPGLFIDAMYDNELADATLAAIMRRSGGPICSTTRPWSPDADEALALTFLPWTDCLGYIP